MMRTPGAAGTNRAFTSSEKALFWAPRALSILIIAFVSAFALDVFGEQHGLWRTLLALAIHLIPSFILILLLAISWRWEWLGAAAFTFCAAGFAAIVRGPWYAKSMFAVPCLLVAGLFFLNWRAGRRRGNRTG